MPAISSRETIPNLPLNGFELSFYALMSFWNACESRGVEASLAESMRDSFGQAMRNDWTFKPSFTYSNARFEIEVRTHAIRNHDLHTAFDLLPVFHFPTLPAEGSTLMGEARMGRDHAVFVRRPFSCPAPPLEFGAAPGTEHVVNCFRVSVKVENPNLIRVHCGLPIKITEKVAPKHGEMFGSFKDHDVRYDASQYEPLPEPVIEDLTEKFCKEWGIPYVPTDTSSDRRAAESGDSTAGKSPAPAIESVALEIKEGGQPGETGSSSVEPPTADSVGDRGVSSGEVAVPVPDALPPAQKRTRR